MAYKYIETKEKTYARAYRVFKGAIPYNGTSINIATKYPQIDHEALTNADFITSYVSDSDTDLWGWFQTSQTDGWYEVCNSLLFNQNYNPTTGVLTIAPANGLSNNYHSPVDTGGYAWRNLNIEVIMIVDGVREEYV